MCIRDRCFYHLGGDAVFLAGSPTAKAAEVDQSGGRDWDRYWIAHPVGFVDLVQWGGIIMAIGWMGELLGRRGCPGMVCKVHGSGRVPVPGALFYLACKLRPQPQNGWRFPENAAHLDDRHAGVIGRIYPSGIY